MWSWDEATRLRWSWQFLKLRSEFVWGFFFWMLLLLLSRKAEVLWCQDEFECTEFSPPSRTLSVNHSLNAASFINTSSSSKVPDSPRPCRSTAHLDRIWITIKLFILLNPELGLLFVWHFAHFPSVRLAFLHGSQVSSHQWTDRRGEVAARCEWVCPLSSGINPRVFSVSGISRIGAGFCRHRPYLDKKLTEY